MKGLFSWFRRGDTGDVDCEAVMRQLWDYLDGELTTDRMHAIEQHVHMCERCGRHVEFERDFLAAVARSRPDTPEVETLKGRVLAALHAEGYRYGGED